MSLIYIYVEVLFNYLIYRDGEIVFVAVMREWCNENGERNAECLFITNCVPLFKSRHVEHLPYFTIVIN